MAEDFIPDKDAGLGLVYRLNILWTKADYASLSGKYNEWNNILDRIYCNLLYREDVIIEEDTDTGEMIRVKLAKKDTKVYKYLSLEIAKARRTYNFVRSKSDKSKAKGIWYHKLQTKDIWLRKFMRKLKLYLKETEKRPGSTLFGGFGNK